ncbi:hypothetical protein HII31_13098, partial [Pseudocercospora fuligena]
MRWQYPGKLCDDSSVKSGTRRAASAPTHFDSPQATLNYFCNLLWLSEVKDNFKLLAVAQLRNRDAFAEPMFCTNRNLQLVSKDFLDWHGAYIWPDRKMPCTHLKQPSEDMETSLSFWDRLRRPGEPYSQGPFYRFDAKDPGLIIRNGTQRYRSEKEQVL